MKKLLTVIAAIIVLLVVLGALLRVLEKEDVISEDQSSAPSTPVQPEWCPDVEVIAAPGTWESSAQDDPIHPTANPASFMLTITGPLQEAFPPDQVKVWTLPYTAQFRNINAMHEMSYDDSRNEGIDKVNAELRTTHDQCPLTDFILTGFSQGAVIVGDITSDIGNNRGVIPAERIRGAAVVADGRREEGRGVVPGTHVTGVGAEIALHPLNALVQPIVPGATMRGTRDGGFGSLNDKVIDLCAPNDGICDAPRDVVNALDRAQAMIDANGVHAQYAQNPDVVPGTTANQWIVQWVKDLVRQG